MGLFHRHDWSDWSISEKGRVFDGICTPQMIGRYIVQDRFCRSCGKHQIHQQRAGSIRSDVKLVPDARAAMRTPQRDPA